MDINEFKNYYEDVVAYVPYCNVLMVGGIRFQETDEDFIYIAWTVSELHKIIPLLLKIIIAFWTNALLHRDFLLERIPKEYFSRFLSISIKNLFILEYLYKSIAKTEDALLNQVSMDYYFGKAIQTLLQVISVFEFKFDSSSQTDKKFSTETLDKIIEKYDLKIKLDEKEADFYDLKKMISSSIEDRGIMAKFIELVKNNRSDSYLKIFQLLKS